MAQADVAVGGNQRTNWAKCFQLCESAAADRIDSFLQPAVPHAWTGGFGIGAGEYDEER